MDMSESDVKVMEHRLAIDLKYRSIKEKLRSHAQKRQKAIAKEVGKILKARFIQKVNFPT